MSDELTHPPVSAATPLPDAEEGRPAGREWRAPALQGVTIVLLCAVLGAFGGWLWERLWTPATGIVWNGVWHKGLLSLDPSTFAQTWSENAHQDVFDGTAIYVVISLVGGLAVGLFASFLLDRSELVTLGALLVGGVIAAALMEVVGVHLSVPDPNSLAGATPNGVVLDDRIHLATPGLYAVFPGAALLALALVFLLFDRGARR